MQLERYSGGEYITEMYVEPGDSDAPTISATDYEDIQYELYDPGEHDDRVLVKVENVFLPVQPDEGVRANVLELPSGVLQKTTVTNPPSVRPVFVQKPWMVDMVTPFL